MWDPALSPDGTKVAVVADENSDWDIWVHDLAHNKQRLTFERGQEKLPRWSPDGSRLFYHHPNSDDASIYSVAPDGSDKPRLLAEGKQTSVAASGDRIVFTRPGQDTKLDIWWLSLDDDGQPMAFLETPANETLPALSPDGRFVAYTSDESGEERIYIRPFPEGPGKWQVSEEQGWRAYWSPAGDRLYFNSLTSLMEVEVSTDPVLRLGTPRLLIDGQQTELKIWRGISVAADGRRFVGTRDVRNEEGEEESEGGIHVVQNWMSDFRD
jgi:serine/threonine-protein kinase